MNFKSFVVIFICLLPISFLGQETYISKGDVIKSGVAIYDYGDTYNSRFCHVLNDMNKIVKKYSPYEIDAYGLRGGKEYFAKDIEISGKAKRVFLELIVRGEIDVYYYRNYTRKYFFIQRKNGLLEQLTKPNTNNKQIFISELISATSDYKLLTEYVHKIRYAKRSLRKFFNDYNYRTDSYKSYLRYGLSLGYSISKFRPDVSNNNLLLNMFDYEYVGDLSIGLFIEAPLPFVDIYIYSDLYMSKKSFACTNRTFDKVYDLVFNSYTFSLPLLFRYKYPVKQFKMIADLGGVLSLRTSDAFSIYESDSISENAEYDGAGKDNLVLKNEIYSRESKQDMSMLKLGYSIGIGVEYKSFSFECRYTDHIWGEDGNSLNSRELHFITAFSF